MKSKPYTWKQLRKSMKLTQKDMAESMGVHHQTYFRWEHGTKFPRKDLQKRVIRLLKSQELNLQHHQIADLVGASEMEVEKMVTRMISGMDNGTGFKKRLPTPEDDLTPRRIYEVRYKCGRIVRLLDDLHLNRTRLLEKLATDFDQIERFGIVDLDQLGGRER